MDLNYLVAALAWGGGALSILGGFCLQSYLREPPYEALPDGQMKRRPHPATALGSTISWLRSRGGLSAEELSRRPTLIGVRALPVDRN